MSIKKISISNFRCFNSVDLEFSKLNNFIHGANGSGKTSVLEALYFCSTGRSFKSSNKNLCVQNDKEAFKMAKNEGLKVVMNRCPKIELKK